MNKFFSRVTLSAKETAVAVGVGAVALSGSASAAIDTSSITAALTDAGTAGGVVAAAVLVVIVGIKAFKFIRAAL